MTKWRSDNPDNVRRHDRTKTLRARYGPDAPALYERLLEAQGGRCAICGTAEKVRQREGSEIQHLAMDHSKASGKVRGLLCFSCNRALGVAGDELDRVMRFVEYLQNPPAGQV